MSKAAASSQPRLRCVQAARGVAALLVILFHDSEAIFTHREYWPRDPLHHLVAWGHLGVELFFVISGFIILQAHWRDLARPDRLRSYATKRFLRIYPVYWLVLLALLPAYSAVRSFGNGHELELDTLVSSFSLVHVGTRNVVLAVSWTLFFEIVFYAVFATLILDRRIGIVVLLVWWVAAVLSLLGGRELFGFYGFAPVTLLFGFGMAAALLYRHEAIPVPGALASAGTVLFVANGLLETYRPVLPEVDVSLLAGLFAAVALAGLVELERRRRLSVPAFLGLVGDASYSIYLVHFPVLSVAAKTLLRPMLGLVPPLVAELVLVVLAIGAGIVFHLLIERPLLAFFSRGRTKVAPALMDGPVAS